MVSFLEKQSKILTEKEAQQGEHLQGIFSSNGKQTVLNTFLFL